MGQSSNSPAGARLRNRPIGRPIGGMSEANCREIKMVADRAGFSLNSIFEELADWEDQLKALQDHENACEVNEP